MSPCKKIKMARIYLQNLHFFSLEFLKMKKCKILAHLSYRFMKVFKVFSPFLKTGVNSFKFSISKRFVYYPSIRGSEWGKKLLKTFGDILWNVHIFIFFFPFQIRKDITAGIPQEMLLHKFFFVISSGMYEIIFEMIMIYLWLPSCQQREEQKVGRWGGGKNVDSPREDKKKKCLKLKFGTLSCLYFLFTFSDVFF